MRREGVFSEKVETGAFAKLMTILLKGMEIQFFHSGDYEALKSTYETMVELLVSRNCPVPEVTAGNAGGLPHGQGCGCA